MGEQSGEPFRAMRVDYSDAPLLESELKATPLAQFQVWLDEAVATGLVEPNAMVAATTNGSEPSARTVLLKAVDSRGFSFFTNLGSRKGRDLDSVPAATLVFPWLPLHRQVLVSGPTAAVPDDEADAYFASRPRSAQIGAWASRQSSTLGGRDELEAAVGEAEARFPRDVPRPPHWGGVLVLPVRVEFWRGRASRLHDRLAFERVGDVPSMPLGAELDLADRWSVRRLSP